MNTASYLRNIFYSGALALISGVALLVFTAEAQAAVPAETFIESSIAQGNAILTNPSLDASQRDREFRDFLLSITDMNRVALFTLGSYAKDVPQPVLTGFVSTFTQFDTALYRSGFGSYGKSLRITGATARSGDDVIVHAEAPDPGKPEPMQIAFRVRKNDAGHDIILDVAVKGVWLAVSQQQGFASFLALHGGDVAMLSHELATRMAETR